MGETSLGKGLSAPTVNTVPEAYGSSTINRDMIEDEDSAADVRLIRPRERYRLKRLEQQHNQHLKAP